MQQRRVKIFNTSSAITWKRLPTIAAAGLDQCFTSLSGLGGLVILGKALPAREFGEYTVIQSLLLMCAGIYNALILYPFSNLATTDYAAARTQYFAITCRAHWVLTTLVTLVLLCLTPFTAMLGISPLVGVTMAVTIPFTLLMWLARRACYVASRPALAATAAVAHGCIYLGGLLLAARTLHLSGLAAFLWAGTVSGCVGLCTLQVVRRSAFNDGDTAVSVRAFARSHWRQGKWILAATVLYAFADLGYTPLVGALLGLPAAGTFRILQALTQPVVQLSAAAGLLFTPIAAATYIRPNGKAALSTAIRYALIAVAVSAGGYVLMMFWLRHWVAALLLPMDIDPAVSRLIPVIASAAIFYSADQVFAVGLAACRKPQGTLLSRAVGCALTFAIGIPLISRYGLGGAAYAYVAATAASAIASGAAYRVSTQGKQ